MPRYAITTLAKGEFGPELYGRVDIPQYNAGVKVGRNFLIQRYGGMAFRPGFRFAGEVDDPDGTYRLTAFQYNIEQAYIQLHGNSQTRFLAEGGFVVEDDLNVEEADLAEFITLKVSHHNYVQGDRVWIDGISGMTQLNNRYATVAATPDSDHIMLDIDSRLFDPITGSTGTIRSAAPPPPPDSEPAPAAPPPPTPPPTTTTSGGDDLGSGSVITGYSPGTWRSAGGGTSGTP